MERKSLLLAGVGVVAAVMIGVPLASGFTGSEGGDPMVPSASPSAQSSSPSPIPTTTLSPTKSTIQLQLEEALGKYVTALKDAGGVSVTVFASNKYATQAEQAPNGDTKTETGSTQMPEIVIVGGERYVELGAGQLSETQALRTKVGKPNARWTSETSKVDSLITKLTFPINLKKMYDALTPGLTVDDMISQPDGSTVITATLNPAKVSNKAARAALALDEAKKSTTVQFNVDSSGLLNRMVVDVKGAPTQTIVKQYEKVKIVAPATQNVITEQDVKKALAEAEAARKEAEKQKAESKKKN